MKDCDIIESFDRKFEKFRSKDTISGNDLKVDGRSKPRLFSSIPLHYIYVVLNLFTKLDFIISSRGA